MDIRQLRYFVAVADALSFTRAAERLNMAQPPLSRQIKALEQEVGVRLLERSRKGLILTPAGRALLQEATSLLAQVGAIRTRVRQAAAVEPSRLSVGFVSAAGYSLLPGIVRRFRGVSPGIELQLHCLTNREQAAALDDGAIAVGLAWLPFERDGARALPLLEDRFCVALPEGHPLAAEDRIEVAMLRRQPVVYGCRTASVDASIRRLLSEAGPLQRVADLTTAIDGVAAGLGLAIVPRSMRPDRAGQVVYRDLQCDERLTLGAVSLAARADRAVEGFLACASALAREQAGHA